MEEIIDKLNDETIEYLYAAYEIDERCFAVESQNIRKKFNNKQ